MTTTIEREAFQKAHETLLNKGWKEILFERPDRTMGARASAYVKRLNGVVPDVRAMVLSELGGYFKEINHELDIEGLLNQGDYRIDYCPCCQTVKVEVVFGREW